MPRFRRATPSPGDAGPSLEDASSHRRYRTSHGPDRCAFSNRLDTACLKRGVRSLEPGIDVRDAVVEAGTCIVPSAGCDVTFSGTDAWSPGPDNARSGLDVSCPSLGARSQSIVTSSPRLADSFLLRDVRFSGVRHFEFGARRSK